MKNIMKKIKAIVLAIMILVGYPVMYKLGKLSNTDFKFESSMLDVANKKIGTLMEKIANQDSLIKHYETKELIDTTVMEVRDINIELFKEVIVKITHKDEMHWRIGTSDYELDPAIFGNFLERKDEIMVKYYYGLVVNNIKVENVNDERIEITYARNSFNTPYCIMSQNTELNDWGKVLTTADDKTVSNLIDDVGVNNLSNVEDEYVKKLRKEYGNSAMPIYINGVELSKWNESCKIFLPREIDTVYSVEKIK